MKEEYITVSEFAELAGVSVQAVYKRYSTEFKVINGKKMLKKSALAEFGLNQNLNQVESGLKADEALLRTVSMLEKELEVKNRQIESLTNLLDQQQKLQAMGIAAGAEKARIEEKEAPAEQQSMTREEERAEFKRLMALMPKAPGLFGASPKDIAEWEDAQEKVISQMTEQEKKSIVKWGFKKGFRYIWS